MRSPSFSASFAQSAIVTPATGMNGITSTAPMRGCSPLCALRSISSADFLATRKHASTQASGEPTKESTQR